MGPLEGVRIVELAGIGPGLADDFDGLIVGVKNLDPAVAKFANVLSASAIDADVVRITQFTGAIAGLAIHAQELTVAGKYLDAMIAGVGDVYAILRVDE